MPLSLGDELVWMRGESDLLGKGRPIQTIVRIKDSNRVDSYLPFEDLPQMPFRLTGTGHATKLAGKLTVARNSMVITCIKVVDDFDEGDARRAIITVNLVPGHAGVYVSNPDFSHCLELLTNV